MGSKLNPGKFDCYANAKPDEPIFIILARDPKGAKVVRFWAACRMSLIRTGVKPPEDFALIQEAEALADEMDKWREENA